MGPATFRRFEWELPYSTAAYLDLLLTCSGHRALGASVRPGLFDCIGRLIDSRYTRQITKRYMTELCIAHRR